MKINKLCRQLVISIGLGAVLLSATVYSTRSEVSAAGAAVYLELFGGPHPVIKPELTSITPAVNGVDAVTEWNSEAVRLTLLPASALAPVQQTRVMAIIQVGVHDAVNGITREYATYLSPAAAPENASPEAAAIAAAHYALRNLFASQAAALDTMYADSLATHGISPSDPGIEYGRTAAAAILASRASDHSGQAQFDYTVPGAGTPGVWTRINNAPALLPGWGNVTPFVLRSASQFRPDAPPALTSEQYTADYNEVKEIGKSNSTTRSPLQTQIASFWRASPTAIWNPVLRQVLTARGLDLSSTARAYALFYLATADASIACWEAKYYYNYWRPMLAIRGGDLDGNPATEADPAWTPLFGTPPHPEYSSGHTTNSSAMASVLEATFGKDPGMTIEVTLSGITRQWSTFDEAAREVIDARVYSGLHFRTADEVGARQGRQVAKFVMTHALRPCKGRGHRCA